ncbi:MAG TPA: hypothetical protein VGN57_14930 [Pirellulaceae bacterium]|jgi:uncharacterized repeat protein (TIGR01451 family)|nr:hypothetical protein [Pirellulaceae bacterium]
MLKRIFTRRRTLAFVALSLFAGGGGAGLSLLWPGTASEGEAASESSQETASLWSQIFNGALIRANDEELDPEQVEGEGAALPPPIENFDPGFVPSPAGAGSSDFVPTPGPPKFGNAPQSDFDQDRIPGSMGSTARSAIPEAPTFDPSEPPTLEPEAPESALTGNGLRGGASRLPPNEAFDPPASEPGGQAGMQQPPSYAPLPQAIPQDPYADDSNAPAPGAADGYAGPPSSAVADYGMPNPYATSNSASAAGSAYGAPAPSAGRLDPTQTAEPLPGSSASAGGVPGARSLEGIQSADVKLVKNAPAEIQVGIPATFELKVFNASDKEVRNVVVRDQTPKGTKFLEGSPQPAALADGSLTWNVGALKPQEELTITMRVLPMEEGEIGSVATVLFATEASARTVCTKPKLAIRVSGPPNVLIGQPAECELVITNEGTGAATAVVIEADLPPQFRHPAGAQLEFEIGVLQPGETRTEPLTLIAAEAGSTKCAVRVCAEGIPGAEDYLTTEVVAPQLAVAAKGPTRRYLQRQAVYDVFVQNAGTAPAQEVDLAAYLPRGMQFVGANNQGQYDPERHAVFWSLVELPKQERGAVQVAVMPIEEGEQKLRVEANAALELQAESELGIVVEAQVELDFQIENPNDPIEVGADALYEIRVTNLGAKAATGVVVAATFPPGLQPLPDQAGSYRVEGQRIVFTNVSRLEPGDEILVKAAARGAAEGDHRVRVEVASSEVSTPILKEARTRVYRDQ